VKKLLLFLFLNGSLTVIWSQNNQRIEINGIILSENQDIEGVTVFNTSSNKGTITNNKGEFNIEVALNDRIEVSALQFKPTLIIVDETAIQAKQLKIYLVEQINQLDAVLLNSGLIGNLKLDIDNVKMIDPIKLNMGNMNMAFEYNDDKAFDNSVISNNLISVMNKGQFYNGINFVQIAGGIFELFVKPKAKKSRAYNIPLSNTATQITSVFSQSYIAETFKIPEEKVPDFIGFLESKNINSELLKETNKLQLIDYLMKQSSLFLELNDIKN
jgi:hypothetical protein